MLEVKNITKLFSEQTGIKNINFNIQEGKIVSVLGENGSGKTTLLKTVTGIYKSTVGTILLNGQNVYEEHTKKNIGYLPDQIIINDRIRVIDLLFMISNYKYEGEYKEEIKRQIQSYCIQKYENEKLGNLSMGNRKKVGAILAFMGNPRLVILDEPTNGMDTQGILQLKKDMLRTKERGGIVLISSHILDFVGTICDKHIFLKNNEACVMEGFDKDLEEIYQKLYL